MKNSGAISAKFYMDNISEEDLDKFVWDIKKFKDDLMKKFNSTISYSIETVQDLDVKAIQSQESET